MSGPAGELVIGYGNRFRGDDAVGPVLAERVRAWGRPEVEALAVHQLTPELATRLAAVRRVLFVDAGWETPRLTCRAVTAQPITRALGHEVEPSGLLGLTRTAYGRVPGGWLLTVPARCFEIGADLSPVARAGIEEALHWIADWLARGSASIMWDGRFESRG